MATLEDGHCALFTSANEETELGDLLKVTELVSGSPSGVQDPHISHTARVASIVHIQHKKL